MNDTQTLLALVKKDQHITWTSDSTDGELQMIIEDAVPALQHKLGSFTLDFTLPGIHRSLFLAYCLYARNQCLNEFDSAYMGKILEARAIMAVDREIGDSDAEE